MSSFLETYYPQLHEAEGLSSPQPHIPDSIFCPRSAALIMAAAQPTPLSTTMALTGQLSAQAPHSMHA
jgi:hypothetical protein